MHEIIIWKPFSLKRLDNKLCIYLNIPMQLLIWNVHNIIIQTISDGDRCLHIAAQNYMFKQLQYNG